MISLHLIPLLCNILTYRTNTNIDCIKWFDYSNNCTRKVWVCTIFLYLNHWYLIFPNDSLSLFNKVIWKLIAKGNKAHKNLEFINRVTTIPVCLGRISFYACWLNKIISLLHSPSAPVGTINYMFSLSTKVVTSTIEI